MKVLAVLDKRQHLPSKVNKEVKVSRPDRSDLGQVCCCFVDGLQLCLYDKIARCNFSC